MIKGKREKRQGNELIKLTLIFQNTPENLTEVQRERLKQLLIEQNQQKGLPPDRQRVLNELTKVDLVRRRLIWGLGLGIPALALGGLSFFQDGGEQAPSTKAEKQRPPTALQEDVNRLSSLEKAKRLAVLTDNQIKVLKGVIEKWKILFAQKSQLVIHPQSRKLLEEALDFLSKQLNQPDNNNWRALLKEPKVSEALLEQELIGFSRQQSVVTGNRVANLDRYNQVNFSFNDDPGALVVMPTYNLLTASIFSGFLVEYAPRYASLIVLHEARHAIDHKEAHEIEEKRLGRPLTKDEHYRIDVTLIKHNPNFLNNERLAYNVEFEMANILSDNHLRNIVQAGGTLTSNDFIKYVIGENQGHKLDFDSTKFDSMLKLINIYFRIGPDLSRHKKEYDDLMATLKTIYGSN